MNFQLPLIENSHVLVIGDLMLDRYWHGATSRISPEAPVPVVLVGEEELRPGGAGNVALNITSLGGQVSLVGLTGDDVAADDLSRRLESEGVHCHFQRLSGKPTITKLRVISRHQQLIRLDFEDGFQGHDAAALMDLYRIGLEQADVVILSDYGKGTLKIARDLIALAREQGKPVLVDPKGSDFARYYGSTLVTPNLSEFEAVVGHCRSDEELVQKGMALIDELAIEALLITRSERGMSLLRRDQPPLHLPTRAREVFDVTGAGDTVISVMAASLASGLDLVQATALSNLAAGIVVGKLGTASVTQAELRRAMREEEDVQSGIVSEESLGTLVQDARAQGETIVMTNGCFDILHAGHVSYLRQARQLGNRLIVAVNDDESVHRLKGEERPINNLAQRMEVLAALEYVDWVVPFSEDTPERLICNILPDILVKGGDYRVDQIVGASCVEAHGGRVVVLGFVEGVSTTRIIESIRTQTREKNG